MDQSGCSLEEVHQAGKSGCDFKDNGDSKANVVPFALKHLMVSCPDSKQELLDLQHLATKISGKNNTVIIEFTPKYHAEIAGG